MAAPILPQSLPSTASMMRRFAILLLALGLTSPALAEDTGLQRLSSGDAARDWTGVGRLDIAGKGFCTAALISETEVLTAAHCLYDRDGSAISPDRLTFSAGYRDGRPVTARGIRRTAPHPAFVPNAAEAAQSTGTDIAIVELQSPIGAAQVTPFAVDPAPRRGGAVGVVSYAVEREEAPSLQEVCGVLETYGPAMILSCEANFGASGAPVFSLASGEARIVGVVTAKAQVGTDPVSLSAGAAPSIATLRAELGRQAEERINGSSQVRVIRPGERNGDIGAKFLRP